MKTLKKLLVLILALTMILSASVPAYADYAVTTASSLNLRKSSNTSSDVLASIPKGTKLTIKSTTSNSSGTWFKVDYNGKTGYISSQYAQRITDTSISATSGIGKITASSSLTLRSGAGTSYPELTSISNGTTISLLEAVDVNGTTWYKTVYGGKTGYVSGKYVSVTIPIPSSGGDPSTPTEPQQPAEPQQPTEPTSYSGTGVVTASSSLTLRSGAGTGNSALTSIPGGKTITITGGANDSSGTLWYKTSYNGKTGYVSSKYVKYTPGGEQPTEPQ
ncbi:MAG: SH3 domain-containing protein, partial [Lachnospiraceae bacterium]|nr:SH3 domain-containing protein [Candidatus Minthocola equi]